MLLKNSIFGCCVWFSVAGCNIMIFIGIRLAIIWTFLASLGLV